MRGRPTPKARTSGLVVERLSDEVLVYDLETHEAHCLNPSAALVWDYCDGRNSVQEITRLLRARKVEPCTEEVVWHALSQLQRFSLLEDEIEVPREALTLSRRELARRLGLAGAASLPFVLSIVAPAAASAATCGAFGEPCAENARCCSGICINGTCACLDQNSNCTLDVQCCSNRCGSAQNKCLP